MDKQKRIELHENMKWDSMKDIKLNCSKDLISTESGTLIMARWESDMMEHHAKVVCKRGGDILEIGFGLGISADFIQQQNIVSHTIIEPHPQIAENARRWAGNNSSIKIIESDWYDVIDELNSLMKKYRRSRYSIMLNYLASKSKNMILIPHTKKISHLKDNLNSLKFSYKLLSKLHLRVKLSKFSPSKVNRAIGSFP